MIYSYGAMCTASSSKQSDKVISIEYGKGKGTISKLNSESAFEKEFKDRILSFSFYKAYKDLKCTTVQTIYSIEV